MRVLIGGETNSACLRRLQRISGECDFAVFQRCRGTTAIEFNGKAIEHLILGRLCRKNVSPTFGKQKSKNLSAATPSEEKTNVQQVLFV